MRESDVGSFYVDENGDIWRMVTYCAHPTATLERITRDKHPVFRSNMPERVGGAVGAPIFKPFRKLVVEA